MKNALLIDLGGTNVRHAFFINNAFLVTLSAIVLLGTIYPIIYEIFSGGDQITVGAPYFNLVTVPFALILLFFQAIGPLTKWGGNKIDNLNFKFDINSLCSIDFCLEHSCCINNISPVFKNGKIIFNIFIKQLQAQILSHPSSSTGIL